MGKSSTARLKLWPVEIFSHYAMFMKILFQICFTMSESDFESDSELSSSDDESKEDTLSSTSDEEEIVENKEAKVNIIEDNDIDVNNTTEQVVAPAPSIAPEHAAPETPAIVPPATHTLPASLAPSTPLFSSTDPPFPSTPAPPTPHTPPVQEGGVPHHVKVGKKVSGRAGDVHGSREGHLQTGAHPDQEVARNERRAFQQNNVLE